MITIFTKFLTKSTEYLLHCDEYLKSIVINKQNFIYLIFRISPRHLLLAIRNDHELDKMLHGVTISQGGVLPYINDKLLPKKTMKNNTTPVMSADISSQEY